MSTLLCRAMVSDRCQGGDEIEQREATEDGTYDRASGTMICDRCFICLMPLTESGRGLNPELAEAIEVYQAAKDHVRSHPHPEVLLAEATDARQVSTPGTQEYRTAIVAVGLATTEINRRVRVEGVDRDLAG